MVFGNEQVPARLEVAVFLHHLVMKFMEVIFFPPLVVCFFPTYTGEAILTHV
jgi:hypothetical protein